MEQEHPKDDAPLDLSRVDAITSLDTARMTLRWALERLHALEKLKAELEAKAASDASLRVKAQKEAETLRRALAERQEAADRRERYYAQFEETFNQYLGGKLTPAVLARREAEVAGKDDELRQRQVDVERDAAAKLQAVEAEQRRLRAELEEAAQAQEKRAEAYLAKRREMLDKEHAARMLQARERELRLETEERNLAARQAQIDEFTRTHRTRLEMEIKDLRAALEEEAGLRAANAERIMEGRMTSLQAAWRHEKALLLREAAEWKRVAEAEQSPRLDELRRHLEEATRAAGEDKAALLNEVWRLRRQAEELEPFRRRAEEEAQRRRESESRAAEAEAAAGRAAEDASRAVEDRANLERRVISLEREAGEREKKLAGETEERRRMELSLTVRLQDAQRELLAAQDAARRADDAAGRTRDDARLAARQLEEGRTAWQREREALGAELRTWLEKAEEQGSKILELQSKLADADKAARLAAETEAREACEREELLERMKALESQREEARRDLEARAETARRDREEHEKRLSAEIELQRGKTAACEARIAELESGAGATEERIAARIAAALAPEAERRKEALEALGAQAREFSDREKDLLAELDLWRKRSEERLAEALESRRRQAEAETTAQRISEPFEREKAARRKVEAELKALVSDYETRLAESAGQFKRREEALEERFRSLSETDVRQCATIAELERRLVQADVENAERLGAELAREIEKRTALERSHEAAQTQWAARWAEREAGAKRREQALAGELDSVRKKWEEQAALLHETEERLAGAAKAVQKAAELRASETERRRGLEEALRKLQSEGEPRLAAAEAEHLRREEALAAELEALRKEREEQAARLREMESRPPSAESAGPAREEPLLGLHRTAAEPPSAVPFEDLVLRTPPPAPEPPAEPPPLLEIGQPPVEPAGPPLEEIGPPPGRPAGPPPSLEIGPPPVELAEPPPLPEISPPPGRSAESPPAEDRPALPPGSPGGFEDLKG